MITHPRVGMDVEVKDRPGTWMIVGFNGQNVDVVSIDSPGEVVSLLPSRLRETWPADAPKWRRAA